MFSPGYLTKTKKQIKPQLKKRVCVTAQKPQFTDCWKLAVSHDEIQALQNHLGVTEYIIEKLKDQTRAEKMTEFPFQEEKKNVEIVINIDDLATDSEAEFTFNNTERIKRERKRTKSTKTALTTGTLVTTTMSAESIMPPMPSIAQPNILLTAKVPPFYSKVIDTGRPSTSQW